MGLTRTSSGLLVRDEFGSDTSADYAYISGKNITISGGVMYSTDDDTWLIHTDTSGCKCVTGNLLCSNGYPGSVVLSDNGSLAGTTDYDGYMGYHEGSTQYLGRYNSGSLSWLANAAYTSGADLLARVYLTATGVTARRGTSALNAAISSTDTTYTTTLYGGYRQGSAYGGGNNARINWLEARTAHTISFTSLPTGYYAKVSDGTTTAKAAESSGTATVDAGAVLFPLATVGVYDGDPDSGGSLVVELDTGDYADMGGGDAFAYSGASAVWLPFMKHNVIGLGGLHG